MTPQNGNGNGSRNPWGIGTNASPPDEAYRQVEEIRGAADAKATGVYASAYNKNPQAVRFYEFTHTMQSYKPIIADNTTLVLSTDSDMFKFLKSMSPEKNIVPLKSRGLTR